MCADFGAYGDKPPELLKVLEANPALAELLDEYTVADSSSFASPKLKELNSWAKLKKLPLEERSKIASVSIDLLMQFNASLQTNASALEQLLPELFRQNVSVQESKLRALIASLENIPFYNWPKFSKSLQRYLQRMNMSTAQADFDTLLDGEIEREKEAGFSSDESNFAVEQDSDNLAPEDNQVDSKRKTNSFTATVKAAVKELFPSWTLDEVTKGNGPTVYFRLPISKEKSDLSVSVGFRKGLYGTNWVSIDVGIAFKGIIRGGNEFVYQQGGEEENPVADYSFSDAEDLHLWIVENASEIEQYAQACVAPYLRDYYEIKMLMNELITEYTGWYKERPSHLHSFAAFLEKEPAVLSAPYPDDVLDEERFESFVYYLKGRGKLSASNDYFLRTFWSQRPMRREDYGQDKYIGNPCTVCGDNKIKGKFLEKNDPIFGPYEDFVCTKCLKK